MTSNFITPCFVQVTDQDKRLALFDWLENKGFEGIKGTIIDDNFPIVYAFGYYKFDVESLRNKAELFKHKFIECDSIQQFKDKVVNFIETETVSGNRKRSSIESTIISFSIFFIIAALLTIIVIQSFSRKTLQQEIELRDRQIQKLISDYPLTANAFQVEDFNDSVNSS